MIATLCCQISVKSVSFGLMYWFVVNLDNSESDTKELIDNCKCINYFLRYKLIIIMLIVEVSIINQQCRISKSLF